MPEATRGDATVNASILPTLPARRKTTGTTPGVFAQLDDLVRLEFKARGFSLLPRQPLRSILAGQHASRLRGRGLNFEEIRRYLPGDDTRSMDWKVTARTRQPHVRVYTEERDRPCLLVIDQRRAMFFGSRRATKAHVAAEIAALAAWRVFHAGDRVGALIFNDQRIEEIRPQRSRNNVLRILKTLVNLNHELAEDAGTSSPGMLNHVLERATRLARHDHLVGIIAGGGGADDQTVKHATRLAEHNDVVVAYVYDDMERQLPEGGRLVMTDGAQQLEIDTGEARLNKTFTGEFEAHLAWMRHITRQRATPLLPISTSRDVTEQLRQLLGSSRA